jgi:hypothetical protein
MLIMSSPLLGPYEPLKMYGAGFGTFGTLEWLFAGHTSYEP